MNTVRINRCPVCDSVELLKYLVTSDHRVTGEPFALDQCSQCGLIVTQDHPVEEEIGQYYETDDYVSHAGSSRGLMDKVYFLVRRTMARQKIRWVEKYASGKRILDIGAGTGFFLSCLRSEGWEVLGVEPGIDARRIAAETHGLMLEDPAILPKLNISSRDVITLWHVLEHVHDPNGYLQVIRQILTERGVLLIALPNYRSFDAKFYKTYWGAWDVPRHLWHFSPRSIEQLARKQGFRLLAKRVLPFDPFYVALISEKYRGGGLLRMLRAGCIGSISFFKGLIQRNNASSVVYIFENIKP